MKKLSTMAISIMVWAAAGTAGAVDVAGSDTLELMTECLLDPVVCPAAAGTTYSGGGSTTGENAMVAGTQEIAPMSRFLDASACGATQTEAECEAVAFDGIVIAAHNTVAAACPDMRSTGTIIVTDENSLDNDFAPDLVGGGATGTLPDFREDDGIAYNPRGSCYGKPASCVPATETGIQCTDCVACDPADNCPAGAMKYVLPTGATARWQDILRILFAGMSKNASNVVANQDCNSDLRHTIANHWGNVFQGGACATGNCTVLEHLWRRSDLSGTTDTFLTLLGLPGVGATATAGTPFCNGYANRNTAAPPAPSTQNAVQDNDPIRRRCKTGDDTCGYDGMPGSFFGPGTLGLVQAIFVPESLATAVAYPTTTCSPGSFRYQNPPFNNDLLCPNGQRSTFGRCLTPRISSTGSCSCLNPADNIPGIGTPNLTDGRAYNRILRDASCAIILDGQGREVDGAIYRFDTACQQADATRQIGCVSGQGTCTLGFAGREATTLGLSDALRLDGQAPSPDSQITSLIYPLSRRLFLCSIKGFENVVDPGQAGLAGCFMDPVKAATCASASGFVPVPGGPVCQDFNEMATRPPEQSVTCSPPAAVNVNACL